MVLFYPALKRKIFEEGREEGRREGREEGRKEWEAWNQRREQALANNQSFDESPPSRNKDDKA
jgi:predicted transposase YdaD